MTTQYQKTIKPFIEKPFIPTEVDKLQEHQKNAYSDISMTNAILVGPKQTRNGQEVSKIKQKKHFIFLSTLKNFTNFINQIKLSFLETHDVFYCNRQTSDCY